MKPLAAGLALVVLAAIAVQVARTRCRWGTFMYTVGVEDPTDQEDRREDVAVLIEGDERIVTDDHRTMDAAISPDGERVVVTKGRGEYAETSGYEAYALDIHSVDDSSVERLASESTGTLLDWSPDGKTIVHGVGQSIWTIDIDGSPHREIFRLPSTDRAPYLVDITWSPDSQEIAFFIDDQSSTKDAELWTMDADGSSRRRVLETDSVDGDLIWSPDGKRFAWSGEDDGFPTVQIAEASGGDPEAVEPYSSDPVWSRDGSRLAYVIGHEGHYDYRIVVGDADGRNERPVPVPKDIRGGRTLDDWVSC